MIQLTAVTRILVSIHPVDFRRGIDGLVIICRSLLLSDPMNGSLFVFSNRRKTSVKILAYDGQGYWLCQKRLSSGRFRYWPSKEDKILVPLLAHELSVLLNAGDPASTHAAPQWRKIIHG